MSNGQKNGVTGGEEETLDRISQLPDALLVKILSLLPTEDAVASCVLSKSWSYLWTSIYNFLFVAETFKTAENFISFVDHVLTHSTCSKIKKFQHDFHHIDWEFDSKISQWLSFAAENKVENVLLLNSHDDKDLTFELPRSLCTCSSLIMLRLSHWVFDKERIMAWNSLKSLKLYSTELDDEDIVILLSSCPALETLELSMFGGFRCLEINSSNLKRLNLRTCSCEGHGVLEIFAPHLQHLELTGDFGYLECRPVNVSSLVTASLTFKVCCFNLDEVVDEEENCREFHQVFRNLVLDYLQKLTYATELIIGSWFAKQRIAGCKTEKRIKPSESITVMKFCCVHVATQRSATSRVEMKMSNTRDAYESGDFNCQIEQSYLAKGDTLNLQSWMSNIVFFNLKNVKFYCFMTNCLKGRLEEGNDKLFELSEFLLKSTMALKKFVIVSETSSCRKCSEKCVSQYLSRLDKKLLDSPRSSRNLMITYKESFA
ncbi:putative F-box/FBD/LRR-repeat protein At4g13965 [Lycium ferocissimum]|uniref:putative F-box/FBD/LRR-repeat protein At4g13965 n=1 Tax=Lycium ferocissimum TaxID=112874 RepID=UPI002815149C|nr:putative F-box/FBD/LRR-repeat protein At4g13965 [Lycium ferocissimum]